MSRRWRLAIFLFFPPYCSPLHRWLAGKWKVACICIVCGCSRDSKNEGRQIAPGHRPQMPGVLRVASWPRTEKIWTRRCWSFVLVSWVCLIFHHGAKLKCVIVTRVGFALHGQHELGIKTRAKANPPGLNKRPMSLTGDYQPESSIDSPVNERLSRNRCRKKSLVNFSTRSPPAGS